MKRKIRDGWQRRKCYGNGSYENTYAHRGQKVPCPTVGHKPHYYQVPVFCGCHCHAEGYCCLCEKEEQSRAQ